MMYKDYLIFAGISAVCVALVMGGFGLLGF